jgi:hypothetical protein
MINESVTNSMRRLIHIVLRPRTFRLFFLDLPMRAFSRNPIHAYQLTRILDGNKATLREN